MGLKENVKKTYEQYVSKIKSDQNGIERRYRSRITRLITSRDKIRPKWD